MKLKLAIICGILIWFLSIIISDIINPLFMNILPHIDITVPIVIIFFTGIFSIIYIRNIETNETVEGIKVGIVFIVIDVILDLICFIIPHNENLLVLDYPLHFTSMIIITISITTFLGYLAEMEIELK